MIQKSIFKGKNGTRYRAVGTQDFKTHFATILRDMEGGLYDAVEVTSNGRKTGLFFVHPENGKAR